MTQMHWRRPPSCLFSRITAWAVVPEPAKKSRTIASGLSADEEAQAHPRPRRATSETGNVRPGTMLRRGCPVLRCVMRRRIPHWSSASSALSRTRESTITEPSCVASDDLERRRVSIALQSRLGQIVRCAYVLLRLAVAERERTLLRDTLRSVSGGQSPASFRCRLADRHR